MWIYTLKRKWCCCIYFFFGLDNEDESELTKKHKRQKPKPERIILRGKYHNNYLLLLYLPLWICSCCFFCLSLLLDFLLFVHSPVNDMHEKWIGSQRKCYYVQCKRRFVCNSFELYHSSYFLLVACNWPHCFGFAAKMIWWHGIHLIKLKFSFTNHHHSPAVDRSF